MHIHIHGSHTCPKPESPKARTQCYTHLSEGLLGHVQSGTIFNEKSVNEATTIRKPSLEFVAFCPGP